MRSECARLSLMAVGLAFVASSVADVSDDFESAALGGKPSGWDGFCAVSNNVDVYAHVTPGSPIATTHVKMLSVEGSAMRTYTSSENGGRMIDLLVKADELPDEELPTSAGDEQIKFAFDTNGCINLFHKLAADSAAAQWSKVSDVQYAGGTWVRTTFVFDYDAQLCQLRIDGSPCVSQYGYRAPDALVHPGSWYCLATTASALASIDFVGCGGVDDVVNASSDAVPAHSGDTATNGVDYAWLTANGLAWDSTAASTPSGYTVKQAFDAGTDPYSENKLYVTNASYGLDTLVLTFNGCGKSYHMETSATPFTDGTAGTDAGGTFVSNTVANTTTWTGTFPTAALTYYRVRNASVAAAETVNQFAIMKIVSSATNTLVALPWKSLGPSATDPAAITAANVVMTNNLSNGDWLIYYENGYKGWRLNNGVWTPTAQVGVGGVNVTAAAANASLVRGQAIWLVRTGDVSKPFYLYGQYQAALDPTTVVKGGSLLANPNVGEVFNLTAGKISGAAAGDVIVVPATAEGSLPKRYEYRNGAWGTDVVTTSNTGPGGAAMSTHTWTTTGDAMKIPAGQGFIYQPKGDGTPTINW